jgi:uncharacterized damage-inducible protein DinB
MDTPAESMLLDFIRYNNWANAQVLAACEQLTPEQQRASTPGSYGSIHATLGHLIAAEASYVGRLTGNEPQPPFRWDDPPSAADLAAFAPTVASALLDAVQRIPPKNIIHEEENGLYVDYQARVLFIEVVNHGIEHRTKITTILSSLGLEAPGVDGWAYTWAHPEEFAISEGSL